LGPTSSLSLVLNAGARFASADKPGVAHVFQKSLVRTVPGETIVKTLRETELRGNSLFSTLTRENIVLTTEFLRDDLVDAVPLLLKNALNTHCYPYELSKAVEAAAVETESELSDPKTKVLDLLHQVAFRSGLGHSLFGASEAVQGLSRADVSEFVSKNVTAGRVAIVGTGISHSELVALVESQFEKTPLSTNHATIAKSRYFGGEARIEGGPGSEALVALAYPSVAVSSPEHPAALVLKAVLDTSKRTAWGSFGGSTGLLASAGTPETNVSAFNVAYSDVGLFGFFIQGTDEQIKRATKNAMDAFKKASSSISAETLARAKKAAVVDSEVGRHDFITTAGQQILTTGTFHTHHELSEAINKVTASDLTKLASAMLKSRPSMVSYGNLLKLPYADEL